MTVYTLVVYTVLVVRRHRGVVTVGFSVSVTGQTVVYQSTTSVVTCGPLGQFVTVGWQEVTVRVTVRETVLVVQMVAEVVVGTPEVCPALLDGVWLAGPEGWEPLLDAAVDADVDEDAPDAELVSVEMAVLLVVVVTGAVDAAEDAAEELTASELDVDAAEELTASELDVDDSALVLELVSDAALDVLLTAEEPAEEPALVLVLVSEQEVDTLLAEEVVSEADELAAELPVLLAEARRAGNRAFSAAGGSDNRSRRSGRGADGRASASTAGLGAGSRGAAR